MSDIDSLTGQLVAFRDARDWEQFHNPKDLALAISIEAAELNEVYLWKQAQNVDVAKVKEELADVIAYSLLLAHHYGLNVREIVEAKIEKNGQKYPVEKARGTAKKYDEL